MNAKRLFLVLLLFAVPSHAQLIGFSECTYNVQSFVSFDMDLIYDGPQDIMGAAVRITGIPTAWIRTVIPSAQADACGTGTCDLFANGAYLTFPNCQTPRVQLFRLTILPTTEETNLVFAPEKPMDSPIDCPYVTLCNAPTFTKQCVGCDVAFVNHDDPICSVPVEEITWTSIRNLYR